MIRHPSPAHLAATSAPRGPARRRATEVDLPALLDLEERTLPADQQVAAPALRLLIRTGYAVVLEEAGAVVAMGIAETRCGTWYLAIVAVDPAHQRKGLGRELVGHLIEQAPPSCHLATAVGVTEGGRGFLTGMGFTADGPAFTRSIGRRAA